MKDTITIEKAHAFFRQYLVSAADVEPAEHDFLLGDVRFPIGEITIIAGSGGVGKGQLAAAHIAMATKGYNLDGVCAGEPVNCLFVSAEDTAADIRTRLDRSLFQADYSRALITDKLSSYEYNMDLSGAIAKEKVESLILETHSRLVYIDPIQAFVGESTDLTRQNQVRKIMHTLATVAEEYRCCIVLLMHLNKRQSVVSAADLLCGSSDIVNAARSVMLLTNDFRDGSPDRRFLFHIKSNHARPAKTLEINIGSAGNRIVGKSDLTEEDYVVAVNSRRAQKRAKAEVNYEQLFYSGIEQMIAEGTYQSTFREFVERFAQGFSGKAKCVLNDITLRVEERLGYTIQSSTSDSCPVKISRERGFRLIKLS